MVETCLKYIRNIFSIKSIIFSFFSDLVCSTMNTDIIQCIILYRENIRHFLNISKKNALNKQTHLHSSSDLIRGSEPTVPTRNFGLSRGKRTCCSTYKTERRLSQILCLLLKKGDETNNGWRLIAGQTSISVKISLCPKR